MCQFDTKKAAQAAAALLKQTPGRQMAYIKLLKLLYVADRESLREIMRPVVGGRHVAMKWGPLHSEAYDLIQGRHPDKALWDQFMQVRDYVITLTSDPGNSELSDYEVDLLTRLAEKYQDIDRWGVVEDTHEFPEWKRAYPDRSENTSHPIHLRDMLDAVGKGAQKREILSQMQEEAREDRNFRRLLASTHARD